MPPIVILTQSEGLSVPMEDIVIEGVNAGIIIDSMIGEKREALEISTQREGTLITSSPVLTSSLDLVGISALPPIYTLLTF